MKEKRVPARSAREFEVQQKTDKSTEQESERRRREMADLLVLPRPAKSLQNGTGFSEKFQSSGLSEKERVVSVPKSKQLESTPEQPLPKSKRTKPSVQIMRWERVKVSESHILATNREIGAGA